MLINIYAKDPAAVLDYYIDWTDWLVGEDTIVTSTWVATGSLTVTLFTEDILGGFTGVWVSGGVVGEHVLLTNHIVTSDGREDERSVQLILRD